MDFDDIIVGSGLGGLAAAARLAGKKRRVLVLERNQTAGGKCGRLEWQGYRFDTGPSVLTLPFVLKELFTDCGKRLEDYLSIHQLEIGCRYFWPDGSIFDAPGHLEGFRAALKEWMPAEVEGFDEFIAFGKKLWEVSGPVFLFDKFTPLSFLRANPFKLVKAIPTMVPISLGELHRRFFKEPKLIQLFDRYATYNGSDPMRTPSTFAVIAYVELMYGSWRCDGGMYALVEALVKLLTDLGGEIRYGAEVAAVTYSAEKTVTGVKLTTGEELKARNVVVNQDAITALTSDLLGGAGGIAERQAFYKNKEASVSGYVTLVANKVRNSHLKSHNVFFCADYRKEFHQIFDEATALEEPTIYVSCSSKEDASLLPEGEGESWFILVNAPSLDRFDDWPDNYGDRVLTQLEKRLPGFDTSQVTWQMSRTPKYFQDELKAWHGSLYGLSSNNMLSAFYRVPNTAKTKGLYFTGGSAHPGGGIPLVLLSGKIAAKELLKRTP